MKAVKMGYLILTISLAITALVILPGLGLAKDNDKNRPARSITMATEYPGVEVPAEEDVSMDIIFHNKGRSDENVEVWLSGIPDGWKARIKTYRYTVTGTDHLGKITLQRMVREAGQRYVTRFPVTA